MSSKDMLLRSKAARLTVPRLHIMRLARVAGPLLLTIDLAVNLIAGALPVLFTIAAAVVVGRVPAGVRGGVHSSAWNALLVAFAFAAVAFIGQQIAAPLREASGQVLARRIDGRIVDELMAAATGTESIGSLEDPLVAGDLRTAARELEDSLHSPGQACAGQLALLAKYTQLTGYVLVVGAAFSWLAAAGLLSAVLLFRYGLRGGLRKYAEKRMAVGSVEQRNRYLRGLAIDVGAAKEIRIFGLIDWFRDYWRTSYLEWLRPLQAARRRIFLRPFAVFMAWGMAVSVSILALLGASAATADGKLSLTRYILVITSVLGALTLGEFYRESDMATAVGMQAYNSARRFLSRLTVAEARFPGIGERPGSRAAPHPDSPDPASTEVPAPAASIHFDGIGFRYPGENRMVFDGLDLTIPAGKCTALVGANGAGKTTLVKLLARLYEPTAGTVRADGVDIRRYPPDAWRAKLAVIFQDFARYEISAADNVAFGAVGHLTDRAGIRSVIDTVGLADALDALPEGPDTVLARHVTQGGELSGGQWQRVALARALFALRHGAPVLVLDEPTASLDVRAEALFLEEFARLTRGATTVLISHRFSTVRQADLIIVLEDGRVIEQGSHAELMGRGGRYAHMFSLQASRFAEDDAGAAGTASDQIVGVP